MTFSKWLFLSLITCSAFQPFIYGASCDPQSSIAKANEHIAAACEELENLYDGHCQPVYLPKDKCCCWGKINFYAESLWWRIFQDGLHYAISGVDSDVSGEGKLFALDGEWDTGFRIGAGIFFPCNAWKLTFDWMRFRNEERDGVIEGALTLRATRGGPGGINTITTAEADLQFKLDSLRLTLQMPLFSRRHIVIKPLVRIRGDWITENFHILYDSIAGTIDNRLKYWGIGPEGGLEAVWYLLPCFGVYGQATVAGLYGHFDIHQTQFDDGSGEEVNTQNQLNKMQSSLSATLGVQWEGVFFNRVFLSLKAGWETNVWFNINSTLVFTDSSTEGSLVNTIADLRTSGLTLRATLAY